MAEYTSNLETIRKIKVKLRKCNMACDDMERLLNISEKAPDHEKKVIHGFMVLYSHTDDILKLLIRGSEF